MRLATHRRHLKGKIDRIRLRGTSLIVNDAAGKPQAPRRLAAADRRTAVTFLLDWLEVHPIFACGQGRGATGGAWHEAFRTGAGHAEAARGTASHHAA
jgi:hypothetical protein